MTVGLPLPTIPGVPSSPDADRGFMREEHPLVVLLHPAPSLLSALVRRWRDSVELVVFEDVSTALARLRERDFWLLVADLRGREGPFGGWLRRLVSSPSEPELLLIGDATLDVGVDLPPESVLREPVREEQIVEQADRLLALQHVRKESGIVGTSPAIRELLATIAQVAPLDVPVLVHGESGTGKEMVARALHDRSRRSQGPFLSINAGSLAETLLESELFGHEKGAFTGAVTQRAGLFERADGGTLFLDELGEMSPGMQVKLLRVLETSEFQRVGGTQTLRTDVRLVAATHRDLEKEIAAGRFRSDLYYRLKVVKIEIPPLRERPDDILVLAQHFLEDTNRRHGLNKKGFTLEALQRLRRYAWPGNVRELRNVVSSMAVLSSSEYLDVGDMPPELREGTRSRPALPVHTGIGSEPSAADPQVWTSTLLALAADVRRLLDRVDEISERLARLERAGTGSAVTFEPRPVAPVYEPAADDAEYVPLPPDGMTDLASAEKAMIQATLRQFDGNRRKTAEQLGISERTLYRKLKHYGIA